MKRFRWGIFGTGAVSAKFVSGLAASHGAVPEFIASRSIKSAKRFAAAFGIPRAIEGYAEAARQGGVDVIYVATPPSEHASHAMLCIEAGIPVLVEKPFATSEAEAIDVARAAKARSVFVMEAMWTRFLPAARALRKQVLEGVVGQPRFVTGNFGTSQLPEKANGMFNAALGGGAIFHLGAYPLSLGQWLFGSPERVTATGTIGTTGVDEDAAFQLTYPGGVIGSFHVSLRSWAPDGFNVLGDRGMIAVEGSIVRPTGLFVTREQPLAFSGAGYGWKSRLKQHRLVHLAAQMAGRSSRGRGIRTSHRYDGNGYHYEAEEVRRCVEKGLTESPSMTLSDSIAVMRSIDAIRSQIHSAGSSIKGAA